MKNKTLIIFLTVITSLSLFSQDISITNSFSSGTTISAADMNANFQQLVDEINALRNRCDTLEAEKMVLPIGTIVASQLDETDFTTISGDSWVLADGRTSTTEYFSATGEANIPDLRGMFLRGLNAGRTDGNEDPDGNSRVAGDIQNDEIKSHTHVPVSVQGYNEMSSSSGGLSRAGSGYTDPASHSGYTGGNETRPTNVAVYYYIKVK